MQYKIIVDKQSRVSPSADKKEYIIDIEELRVKGNIYDSIVLSKSESYIMRRLSLSEFQVLSVLEEPVKEVIENLNIKLFEGDNYIYLIDMTGNKFYAEYLIKNEFNKIYVTSAQMNSAINETAQSIELSVNRKLEGYSTTEEMNATIKILSDAIALELVKKINDEDLTGASIALRINNDTSEAKINADKVEITANDILNLLANMAINLTSKNITITSDNFSVDEDGNMSCSNANITGGKLVLTSDEENPKVILKSSNTPNSYTEFSSGAIKNYYNGVFSFGLYPFMGLMSLINTNNPNEKATVAYNIIKIADALKNTTITPDGVSTPLLTQTSLKSKKKNIKKSKINALDLIKNADICEYNLKGEGKGAKKHIGLIIGKGYNCPDEIISEGGEGIEAYSQRSISWKAIQELLERVERLEANK